MAGRVKMICTLGLSDDGLIFKGERPKSKNRLDMMPCPAYKELIRLFF
jgi:hypothetical protein